MPTEFVEDVKKLEKLTIVETSPISKMESGTSIDIEVQDYVTKFLEMSNAAKDNDDKEKAMGLKECLQTFPRAVMWSIVLSLAIVMEGYDLNLLSSMYGFDAFNKKFGTYYPDIDKWEVPTKWQTSLSMAYSLSQVLGLFIAGIVADKVGYRKTMMVNLIACVALIFIQFFAPNIETLLAAYVLLGVNWGAYQTLTVTYASEVAPVNLRLYLTTYVNMCWVFGQLISSGVLKGVSSMQSANAWRIPYAIQWAWPVPLFMGVFLAPESPWFLVKKGRDAEAKHSLKRLLTEHKGMPDKDIVASAMLAKIQMTVKEEEAVNGSGSIKECFTGENFRRTRIASLVWMFQSITGGTLMGYSTYFYIQAGLSTSMSFTFSIIQYCLGLIGTAGSWFLSQKLGRYSIWFYGLCTQFVILVCVGGLGFAHSTGASWAIGSLLLVYTFVYDLTVGPICYCIVAELPSSRLRINTVMLARNLYNIANIVTAIITPYMLNPTAWNWKAKTGLFWAGFCIIAIVWSYFELPETKNRTYAELDVLFHKKTRARDFKKTEVDVFDAGELMEKLGDVGIKNMVKNTEHIEIQDA